MKQLLILSFILICLTNCRNNRLDNDKYATLDKELDTISFSDFDSYCVYRSHIVKNNPTYLELCKIDSLKATIDIENGKLLFFNGYDRTRLFDSHKNLPKYLKKNYNIDSIELLSSCMVNDSSKYEDCYEKMMHDGIDKKLGMNFLDKSKRTVDSIYHHENKDMIHSYTNSYSLFERYVSKDNRKRKDSITQNIIENINIPKDFEMKHDKTDHINVHFIITKTGKIDRLKLYSNNTDKEYDSFLISQIKNHVLKTKWKPVKLYGINLNTEENLFIYF